MVWGEEILDKIFYYITVPLTVLVMLMVGALVVVVGGGFLHALTGHLLGLW